jgi:lipopolysaccharide transport system permease protein
MKRIFLELCRYQSLVIALVERHLSVRYRGSLLGFVWSFLNPLCLMLVYTLVFHYYIKVSTNYNYTLFVFCGLLPWLWTGSALHEGSTSLVTSGHLITKAMFPPHLLPLVAVLTNGFNFLLSLILLFVFFIIFGAHLSAALLFLPVLIFIQFIFLYGGALMLASLNVLYRDVQHLVGHFLSFMFFLCPIVYPLSSIPERFRHLAMLNPFALFTISYQNLFLDGKMIDAHIVLYMMLWSAVSLLCGVLVFDLYRERFAELL